MSDKKMVLMSISVTSHDLVRALRLLRARFPHDAHAAMGFTALLFKEMCAICDVDPQDVLRTLMVTRVDRGALPLRGGDVPSA